MVDPLSDVIGLLRPRTVLTKGISGAGAWAVQYSAFDQPGFCTVLQGRCRLAVEGQEPVILEAGDFVLLPATPGFVMSGFEPAIPTLIDARVAASTTEEVRHGSPEGEPDVRLQGGYFVFDSPDSGLLVSMLPAMVHVRGVERLLTLVGLVSGEARELRAGRDLVLSRLVEILLVEALRSMQDGAAPPGLLRGLADSRVSASLRRMHGDPARPWTVATLAAEAALSRSAFFDRFLRVVGVPPMEYLMGWRMALARDMLRRGDLPIAEIAERVGYGSASTFSTAFSRHVGLPPGRYGRSFA